MKKEAIVFFKNYDYAGGKSPTSPGTGLYQHMDEYKSVEDFRKSKKKKKNRKKILAELNYKSALWK